MATPRKADGGRAMVNVFDGTRQPYSDKPKLLITVIDGNQKTQDRDFHDQSSVLFTKLPLFNNFGDNYTFLASADGYKDTGFQPVKLAANVDQIVDLMLIPKSNQLNFADATWKALGKSRPGLQALFANGASSDQQAAQRYGDILEDDEGLILACLLNITTAMLQIQLPQQTPLDYIKRIIWDREGQFAMAQDRFYAWADPQLKEQIKQAKQQPHPKFADAPFILHPGATSSYKEIEFGEANVQFTFHENDRLKIDGVNCVMLEPDIDYFRNTLNHLVLEVAVNAFGSLTDPKAVCVLRWIAGRRAGVPEFDPLCTIQKS
jgi:hypothetical protein